MRLRGGRTLRAAGVSGWSWSLSWGADHLSIPVRTSLASGVEKASPFWLNVTELCWVWRVYELRLSPLFLVLAADSQHRPSLCGNRGGGPSPALGIEGQVDGPELELVLVYRWPDATAQEVTFHLQLETTPDFTSVSCLA